MNCPIGEYKVAYGENVHKPIVVTICHDAIDEVGRGTVRRLKADERPEPRKVHETQKTLIVVLVLKVVKTLKTTEP